MKLGLVLGGGGLIGLGYHAGVLKALADEGIDVKRADVIVGTSAGSIVASYLATGWDQTDFYEYTHGRHPKALRDPDEQRQEVSRLFHPLYRSRTERVRRSVGSLFAMASSRGYVPGAERIPARIRNAFPSGMYSTDETRLRLHDDLPQGFPDTPELLICAADLLTGRRTPFGAPDAPAAALPDAVAASCAIPGIFPPVDVAGRSYVDGGIVSATSLDLAVDRGCEAILCIAPLGYRKDGPTPVRDPRQWAPVVVRSAFARSLRREVRAARAGGVSVAVLRPWLSDLVVHGTNSMRHHDRVAVAEGARAGTIRALGALRQHPALDAFGSHAPRRSS
ncbi:MAG TPA: patatin-like phospholipase family protein [Actinomycetota bacterium]|nr:patatin-like phospholipase family protein [Actinomycetota bacterium]